MIFLLCNNLFIYQVLCTLIYHRRSLYSFLCINILVIAHDSGCLQCNAAADRHHYLISCKFYDNHGKTFCYESSYIVIGFNKLKEWGKFIFAMVKKSKYSNMVLWIHIDNVERSQSRTVHWLRTKCSSLKLLNTPMLIFHKFSFHSLSFDQHDELIHGITVNR